MIDPLPLFTPESNKAALPEFSVTEISNAIKGLIEDKFSNIRVRGEISGLKVAASGHIYFNLKDDQSVLMAVCFRGVASSLNFKLEDGVEVICTGKVSSYPSRSVYQLIVNKIEIAGVGALLALLEKRKKLLAAEGLFDQSRKKSIPYLPKTIAVVTSPTGAVIRDILHRISDRFPVHVLIWGVLVQGSSAAEQVANAIRGFNNLPSGFPKIDVMIVARGGGSIEDLWAFNEEIVVRAVADSKIPVISAIGHETDTTLIDYVADLRAPTPTAAAELALPVRKELLASLEKLSDRLNKSLPNLIKNKEARLLKCQEVLNQFSRYFDQVAHKISRLELKMINSIKFIASRKEQNYIALKARLSPKLLIRVLEQKIGDYKSIARLLTSLDYKNVLKRGFALIWSGENKIIHSSAELKGEFEIEFSDGKVKASTESASNDEKVVKNTTKHHNSTTQGNLF
jgi:exodeoxyribonuclease VII large subunit